MLNKNFRDMLSALNDASAEYLVVGAYALSVYGPARATGDFDIWIRPTKENADRVWRALDAFGAPRRNLRLEDLYADDVVFQIGVAPNRIDILTSISGVEFDEAWPHRVKTVVDDLPVSILGRAQLLKNKHATGRPKDLADIAWLESLDN